jgi:uncharacterized protein (TIGR02145 family)
MKKDSVFKFYSIFLIGFLLLGVAACNTDDEEPDPVDAEPGTVVDIDGNTYKTVTIGTQEWMAENLRTTKFRDGSDILYLGEDTLVWMNNNTPAYSWYQADQGNRNTYGALYNWYTVRHEAGLCPEGWRVFSNNDWNKLLQHLMQTHERSNDALDVNAVGKLLKSCRQQNNPLGGNCDTGVHPRWNPHADHYGTDDYEFSATPGGLRTSTGSFLGRGAYGLWWTSSEFDIYNATVVYLNFDFSKTFQNNRHKNHGMSVRCMRDVQ